MGYVFVQTKAPQYANVDYTTRFNTQVDQILRSLPEFQESWFSTGGENGANGGFGGVLLKDWSERKRSADVVQDELAGWTGSVTGVYAAAFQGSPLPAGSGGLPVQMVIRSSDDYPQIFQTLEAVKWAAWGSGLFAFVDSDLAFDSPNAQVIVDHEKAGRMG